MRLFRRRQTRSDPPAKPEKTLLRFITCGSVDDGKSSLLGRLLYETGSAFEDELAQCGGDLSRLVDGLEAEREQGITIDVAWRFFETETRKFIVADAPGHEQYTRNLVTGASTAELALVLVDARQGVLTQTRRHAFLCRLLGVRSLALVVNKMDLVGYDRAVFDRIVEEFRPFADAFLPIPVSATAGDNVTRRSDAMAWYEGPTLLGHLEAAEPEAARTDDRFWLPVQAAIREPGFRGVAGLVVNGSVRPRDSVFILPAGTATRVERVLVAGAEAESARAGQSVTLTFSSEVDCSRGDLVSSYGTPDVADQFEATIVWMGSEELVPGRQYALKLATQTCLATLQPPKHEIDMATLEPAPAKTLALNGIGLCDLWTDRPLVFAPYEENRDLGGFILIDRVTNDTVGAGLIRHALRRSHNIHAQPLQVSREARAGLKEQKPRLLWFTGLSGAGKSTIANLVEAKLHARGRHTFLLDGDNVRLGLNRDLGFGEADRAENIRRVGETAKLMLEAGLIVLAAFISPFRAERRMVREMLPEGEFVEIFVDVPLSEAERRDPKGLYAKARDGQIPNFTGIGSPYEPPERPDIRIDTTATSAEEAADAILRYLLDPPRRPAGDRA
ncbi:MAG: adenylyl-sulfate kinase [Alphaproteobacteria bacterium]|nr:adenylyl-sulfate kinase [Alphaproteobacteria bacterium]MBV9370888.1 adenylyl-sulfate kinase [Alphaproteobacteria bacterium]MBV9899678.1 adenylyl-sulfate kinase [Alphaproteobacteria bacterium]